LENHVIRLRADDQRVAQYWVQGRWIAIPANCLRDPETREPPGRALVQLRLVQLHRAIGIRSSARYIALLVVYRSLRLGREVDVRAAVRQLVVYDNPAGAVYGNGSSNTTRRRRNRA